jgi:hypothetical protein
MSYKNKKIIRNSQRKRELEKMIIEKTTIKEREKIKLIEKKK